MTQRIFIATALAAVMLAGCDSVDAPNETPVAPIPSAAFYLSTDAFPDDETGGSVGKAASTSRLHFLNAAGRVGVVSTVVGLHLALPHKATEVVTRETPVVADGVWAWETTADVLGTPVDLRLEAEAEGSEVAWRLVSARQGGTPFTYYTATTGTDGKTGSWRLFHPDEEGAVVTATFDVRDLGDREVTFAVPAGRESGGSSVRYRTRGDEQTFDWDDQPEGDRALIVWSRTTGAGSIEAATYNDGARACWDDQLRDVACP